MKPPRQRPRGTTFVEALIAFLVLSLGLLAVSKVQGQLRLSGETARQRSEAVRLAQEDIEQLRSFSTISASGTARSYADAVTSTRTVDPASGYASNTAYKLARQVATANVLSAKNVVVTVSWADRGGSLQRVTLASVIAANDPALSGALGVAPAAATVNGPMARAIGIPADATSLGDGRSVYQPGGSRAVAYVFDNASGAITERCPADPGATAVRLTAADLGGCVRTSAYLLNGVVRFTATATTDQAEPPLPAAIRLNVSGGTYPSAPECHSEAVATAVDRYLAYVCVVYPRADGTWSGQSRIVPDGWTVGTKRSDRHVCPYRIASGGPSAADGERMASYAAVSGTLTNQNFRVIRGDLSCTP